MTDSDEEHVTELPDEEFDLIYADPPWQYDFSQSDNRKVENHYPTLSLDSLKEIDLPASDDCVLYLWTTAPKVTEACDVLNSWGFAYKTCAVWDKRQMGMGHWFRGEHELLFVATHGSPSPPPEEVRRSSIFRESRGSHSEKPAKVREHIEKAHPDAKKLELFSRDGRVGWTMWGNEVPQNKQTTFQWLNEVES